MSTSGHYSTISSHRDKKPTKKKMTKDQHHHRHYHSHAKHHHTQGKVQDSEDVGRHGNDHFRPSTYKRNLQYRKESEPSYKSSYGTHEHDRQSERSYSLSSYSSHYSEKSGNENLKRRSNAHKDFPKRWHRHLTPKRIDNELYQKEFDKSTRVSEAFEIRRFATASDFKIDDETKASLWYRPSLSLATIKKILVHSIEGTFVVSRENDEWVLSVRQGGYVVRTRLIGRYHNDQLLCGIRGQCIWFKSFADLVTYYSMNNDLGLLLQPKGLQGDTVFRPIRRELTRYLKFDYEEEIDEEADETKPGRGVKEYKDIETTQVYRTFVFQEDDSGEEEEVEIVSETESIYT